MKPNLKLGLELFIKNQKYKNNNIGILCQSASINKNYEHITSLLLKNNFKIKCIFSPQHGYNPLEQDNMKESKNYKDRKTNLPIYSLYSKIRKPSKENLSNIDTLIIDLQDIGTRVYTYIYTMALSMISCKENNKKVIVLDRPNPINGISVEGSCLNPNLKSFVGMYPIPMRHGMTIGEIAKLFNKEYKINCNLTIIKMTNYNRTEFYNNLNLPWIMPSPNIPTLSSAILYPATVILEGTNISEGRGTTKPFEIIGAPFIKEELLKKELDKLKIPGIHFRETSFKPIFNKFKDQICHGIQIHIINKKIINSYVLGLKILKTIYKLYPKEFKWKSPPYEYNYTQKPIDLILGTSQIRENISSINIKELENKWGKTEIEFNKIRSNYLLY